MATTYRFLPWARRGLAAALPTPAAVPQGTLPPLTARPTIDVTVSITGGVGDVTTSSLLHGPGDVVGIDPRQVIRCTPLPGTTSAEPNYLVAVDFDAPELPWLFTPIGAPTDQHLPPWIVLIVVEAREGVTLAPAAPLPRLTISSGAAAELPDLNDSWAWAHVQLLHSDALAGDPAAIAAGLAAAPNRNVSRLVSPRRLEANRQWIAAVVPAFDVGVKRGLGAEPKPDDPATHAWSSPDSIVLPVYHHWEFATGPEGDFESLARRIKPYEASLRVGVVPMFVGDGAPPLRVPAQDPQVLDMDGALRAPAGADGRLDDVPDALAHGLQEVTRTLADAADGVIDGHVLEVADRQPVGPPVLASAHVRRWQVKDGDAQWFREVNLDPRPRVSAGLGAEVVRENQEDLVNAAWRQVGDVLAAEAALQRAALSAWAATSFHGRHIVPMADDRLLELTAPMATRVPLAGTSMTMAVQRSSLPDAILDAGMRRALAPAGRAVARAAHRVGVSSGEVRPGMVARLAKGTLDVDPTLFERPALTGLSKEALEAPGATVVSALGLTAALPDGTLAALTATATALSGEAAPAVRERIVLRSDLARTGILGQAHVDAARELSADVAGVVVPAVRGGAVIDTSTVLAGSAASILDDVLVAAPVAGGVAGVGLLVGAPAVDAATGALTRAGAVTVDPLDLDRGGRLVVRTGAGQANIPVAALHPDLGGTDLSGLLTRLPAGTLARPEAGDAAGAVLPVVTLADAGVREAGRLGGTVAGEVRPAPVRAPRGTAAGATLGPADMGPIVGRVPEVTPVVVGTPVVTLPDGGAAGGDRPDRTTPTTVVMPPLIVDPGTLGRLEAAVSLQATSTLLTVAPPVATFVAFDVGSAMTAVRAHAEPKRAQALRRDALIALADRAVGELSGAPAGVDGWWATHEIDRIMAYPTFPVAAYELLARYDRTRFCPGVDEIPPESVTLLETNPRFIASFMVGLNHETNRELLWRGYPTDSRGTPFRHFWARLDGHADIDPIHGWRTGSLADQTTDPKGNLVLLLRGNLLRRYPNTIVVAMPATGPSEPDRDPAKLVHPIFAGRFDPDVSFFGFPLQDTDLTQGQGYFFALMEPVTEPRFGLDETEGPSAPAPADWSGVGWGDTGVAAGAHLSPSDLAALHVSPMPNAADGIAEALFQHPFALYVHARHLVTPLPAQK
jgi:hypothetical protein